MINPLPGTEISSSDSYSYDSAEHRFEVISIHFKTLDVLELSPDGHRRAKSILNKNEPKRFLVSPLTNTQTNRDYISTITKKYHL